MRSFLVGHHGIHLSEPWPKLSGKIMQSRLRSTIQQQRKAIEKEGPVTFEYHDCDETLHPAFDRLMAMRKNRFDGINRPDMPESWKNFYRTLTVRKKLGLGVNIATMMVGGQEVASCFGLTRDKTYYVILPTFQMGKWEPYRPGLLLFDALLTRQEEKGYFDFTVGDEVYKKRFGCERRPLYEWMFPRSFRGLIIYGGWLAKEALRSHPRLFAGLKKIVKSLKSKGAVTGSPAAVG
jgi:CelD/BcsL family acetyltransferase involved in cellulose biosynthesis